MSADAIEPGEPVVRIALPIVCESCGETTRLHLTVEQAERLARGLQAAAAGLEPVEIEVRGQG